MFHDIAYKAKGRKDLLAGIDEFLDEVIVLPPGEWDPDIRIEPPKSLPSSDKRSDLIRIIFQMKDAAIHLISRLVTLFVLVLVA